ncbi:MAG: acyltransferase family protein [bacterium]|nr:acyltransferase family protein [bacterium]
MKTDHSSNGALHPKYRPDIDGLRAVAILAVVLFHAFPNALRGGFIGVDIFFVISGFLITTIITANLDKQRFTYADFYTRRIRRIFPSLIVVLGTCWLLGWFSLFADEFKQLGKHIAAGSSFMANLALWSESGYFDNAAETKPLLHLWSLGIEEQFYIFWPLLLGFIWNTRATLKIIVLVFVASFAVNIYLMGTDATAAFYSPFSRVWELMAGGMLAWAGTHRPQLLQRSSNLQSFIGLALLAAGLVLLNKNSAFPGWWALLPVLGAVLLVSAGPATWINRNILANRVMVWFGLISYPLYLWHWPLIAFTRILRNEALSTKNSINVVLLSVLLAWLTYRFVESPIRRSQPGKTQTLVLSLLMLVILIAGFVTWQQDGIGTRKAATVASQKMLDEVRYPVETTRSNGSCQTLLGITDADVLRGVCIAQGTAPRYLIIGDSHGLALNSATMTGRSSLPTLFLGQHGCLPFTHYTTRTSTENSQAKGCNRIAAAAIKEAALLPSVKTILLSTRGPFYFSGAGFGIEGRNDMGIYDEQGHKLDAPRAFVKGYSETVAALLKTGKQVVFVIDWPELGVDPKGCIGARLIGIGKSAGKSDCTNPRSVVDARQKQYRELVQEIKAQNPALKIHDPLPLFCDVKSCRGKSSDQVYYFDKDHLSPSGSVLVLNDFLRREKQNP